MAKYKDFFDIFLISTTLFLFVSFIIYAITQLSKAKNITATDTPYTKLLGQETKTNDDKLNINIANDKRPYDLFNESKYLASFFDFILVKSRLSMWVSWICIGLGFVVMIYTIISGQNDIQSAKTWIPIIGSAIIEIISATILVKSKSSEQLMATYFDKLIESNQKSVSKDLTDSIEDSKLKNMIKARLIFEFSGIKITENEFNKNYNYLNPDNKNNDNTATPTIE